MNNLNFNSPVYVNQEEINFSTNHMDLINTTQCVQKLELLLQILDFILGHSIIHYVDQYAMLFFKLITIRLNYTVWIWFTV